MFYFFNLKKLRSIFKIFLVLIVLGFLARYFVMSFIFEKPFNSFVEKYSQEFSLDEHLVYSVMFNESRFDKNALSYKNAKGLMQITDRTGIWGAEVNKIENFETSFLFDPEINIKIGCWYLSALIKQYDGEIDTAVAAYNAGSGNVSGWLKNEEYSADLKTLEKIPFEETEKYVQKVKIVKKIYDFLY